VPSRDFNQEVEQEQKKTPNSQMASWAKGRNDNDREQAHEAAVAEEHLRSRGNMRETKIEENEEPRIDDPSSRLPVFATASEHIVVPKPAATAGSGAAAGAAATPRAESPKAASRMVKSVASMHAEICQKLAADTDTSLESSGASRAWAWAGSRTCKLAQDMTPEDLASIADSMARVGLRDMRVLFVLGEVAIEKHSSFQPQAVQQLLRAYAKLKVRNEPLFDALVVRLAALGGVDVDAHADAADTELDDGGDLLPHHHRHHHHHHHHHEELRGFALVLLRGAQLLALAPRACLVFIRPRLPSRTMVHG